MKDFDQLYELGGFPEPFLGGKKFEAQRWSREYRQRLFQDDILSIETIEDVATAELLLLRLPELVGSPLSVNALREDLQVSHKAVTRWLQLFANFYAVYYLSPFGSPKIKALKKERKHYHYDWSLVKEPGPRFENLIASHLLKWVNFYQDTQGRELDLCYFKDRDQREVDFIITEDSKPLIAIEAKLSEKTISPHLVYLKKKFPAMQAFQILKNTNLDYENEYGIRLGPANSLLSTIKNILM